MIERKRQEEERRQREVEEKKAKENEEKMRRLEEAEKRRQLMLQAQKVAYHATLPQPRHTFRTSKFNTDN